MMQRSKSCDPRRLEQFLNNRLSGDAHREMEAHLLICQDCRSRLDQLAGGANWWTDVRRYLGGDGAAEFLHTRDSLEGQPASAAGLDFLKTSDDPRILGRLGPYHVNEILGQGGMGVVLKAFDPTLNRSVAIKVLAAPFAMNGAARKRFAREAQAAAAILHDNVVPVHAIDAEATPPYLVMAFIPGQSLQQRLDRCGPLEIREILRIGMQVAAGLAAAHAQGIIHRDIKPANIMLEDGLERVRITDFGLARAVDDGTLTQSGAVAGTPQYMAPEQAGGEAIDERADLFSLGSTLYAMCTGRAPFRGDSGLAIIRQVCDKEPTAIRLINPDIPIWLEGIIRKLHAKDPANRFQSASEVAGLLERCLAHVQKPDANPLPPAATQAMKLVPGPRPRARRARGRLPLALGLLLVVPGILFLLMRDRTPIEPEAPTTLEVVTEASQDLEAIPDPSVFHQLFIAVDAQLGRMEQGQDPSYGGAATLGMELNDLHQQTLRLQRQLTLFTSSGGDSTLGAELYDLGVQTQRLRQLMAPTSESRSDYVDDELRAIKQRLEQLWQQVPK